MKNNLIVIAVLTVFTLTPATVFAHSGRTDSSGGHNCSASSQAKGLCSGYHYHNGSTSNTITTPQRIVTPVTIPSVIPTLKPTAKPTTEPTIKPIIKPSPTSTPTPTLTPTSSPNPTLNPTPSSNPERKVTQTQPKKSKGFFGWFFSLFSR